MDMPASVIGLMDAHRLWFKSAIGLGVKQLDRQIAFCAHAIMTPDDVLVVEDLQKDNRFADNPLVTQSPNLRFYAGAPLIDSYGHALGTIAVADVSPRKISDGHRNLLKDLAGLVVSALDNRQQKDLLGKMALTDHLTGLANRVQFERTMRAEISHFERSQEPFTIFYQIVLFT
jgi:GAF domain-containing protein